MPNAERAPDEVGEGMERYRIEGRHVHGVKPGNIVDAIANEAGAKKRIKDKVKKKHRKGGD